MIPYDRPRFRWDLEVRFGRKGFAPYQPCLGLDQGVRSLMSLEKRRKLISFFWKADNRGFARPAIRFGRAFFGFESKCVV